MSKKITLVILLISFCLAAQAAYTPISLTGFNEDIVVNGSGVSAGSVSANLTSTYNGIDDSGDVLVAQNYIDPNGNSPQYYLPASGLLTSALTSGLTFQLADYSSNNALYLVNSSDNGTLAFTTPQSATSLYLLGFSANGTSTFDVVVNFSDGTSQTFSNNSFNSWYSTSASASVAGIGRVNAPNGQIDLSATSQDPHLYELQLALDAANYTKTITNVAITKTSAVSSGYLLIMGISAHAVCYGTPIAGTVTATNISSSCAAYTTTLTLTGATTADSLVYQWQSSTDGVNFTNASGATNATYLANVTAGIYYRDSITCQTSGLSSITPSVDMMYPATLKIATLPYYQGFESWMGACYSNDRPDSSWTLGPTTGNPSWRRDDQGADATWGNPAIGSYSPVSFAGGYSARFHSRKATPFGTEGNMDLHVNLSTPGTKGISFYYINPIPANGDGVKIELSENGENGPWTTIDSVNVAAAGWVPENATTTSTAANAVIRFAGISGGIASSDIGIDSLSITVLTPCSGMPAAGTIIASRASGCGTYTSTMALSTDNSVGGLTYQWDSSTDGVTYIPINGATGTSYATTVTANVYYRVITVCTSSSDTATSAPIELKYNTTPIVPSVATLPYSQGFESWLGTCYNYDRPDSNWVLNPMTGDDSWRRDDQGADASWVNPTSYMYTPASFVGSHSARFHSGQANNGSEGDMDLHVNLSTPGTKGIDFYYINTNGSDYMAVELSEDGGTTFTTIDSVYVTDSWTLEQVTTTSVAANAIIRFAGFADFGVTDIGIDSLHIAVLTPCSGTPIVDTVSASQTVACGSYISNLTLNGVDYTVTGLSYQWEFSTDSGVTYTQIAGATGTAYTANVTQPTYYRVMAVCANSSDTGYSAPAKLNDVTPAISIATVPYFQGFESWMGTCYSYDRPDSSWTLNPPTGNNSWRRDDQGTDANWLGGSTYGTYTPASIEGSHSARFHTVLSPVGSEGDMDLHINLSTPGTKAINFYYITGSGGVDSMEVELSEDTGNTWTTLGVANIHTGTWEPLQFTTNSVSPNAIIRLAGFGVDNIVTSLDIGIDSLSVVALTTCAGMPTAGPISASQLSGCYQYTSNLTVPAGSGGLAYQWESSADGVTYTPVSGATSSTYAATVSTNVYYRAQVICTNSQDTATSDPIELMMVYAPVASNATLPYFQGFESWIGTCFNYDRPDSNWLLNPVQGNTSWRRDDQGQDANWTLPAFDAYTPASSQGSHSARFHSGPSYDFFDEQGNMDLHIDLSAPGTKTINFDYINADGTDYMKVELSEDSGTTFTTIDSVGIYSSSWVPVATITNSVSAHAILRFAGFADGSSNIGVDSLSISVLPTCTGMPTASAFTSTVTSGCTPYTSILAAADSQVSVSGIAYQWQWSTDGTTFTNIPGATGTIYNASVNASTFYRLATICTTSNDTATSFATELTYTPEPVIVATLPYFQGFESWSGGMCNSYDRPDSSWINNPNTGNNSWRRDDQGADAGWLAPALGAYSGSTEGSHSARFHTYIVPAGQVGDLDLHINLSTAGTKLLRFDYINMSGTDSLRVELSEDSGATFTTLNGYASNYSGWQAESIDLTSVSPHAVLRFSAISDAHVTDIGLDSLSIYALPFCSGQPVAGSFSASETTGCSPYQSTLSADTPMLETGITYQWQSSTNGTAWTTIAGATGATYSPYIFSNTYYRFIVKCTLSNDSDSSAATELIMQSETASAATLPYFQGFESWTGYCNPTDRPDANWLNGYVAGNYSWRRDDQGVDANWSDPLAGQYTPASTEGSHSASFNSYDAGTGVEGDLNLHLNLSQGGTKVITFDYHNDNGSDYLVVELSENGGSTWTGLDTLYSGATTGVTGWSLHTLTTNSLAANAILRFAGFGDGPAGSDNIGIDSLSIALPSCDTISGLAVTGIAQNTATITWDTVAGTAGYEMEVDTTAANPATGAGTVANSYATNGLLAGTTYYVHVRDSCGPGTYSAWTTISFTTPGCDAISGLAVSNITNTGATISWNSSGSSYEYSIGTVYVVPSTDTVTTSNGFSPAGLAPHTVYYVFVRDSCGPNDFSNWDTLSFSTTNLGISSIDDNFNVDAYPNPASNMITVQVYGQKGTNRKVSLTDVAGRVIRNVDMATDRVNFDMNNLASGIYLIRYEDDTHARVIKVNKQ